MVCFAKGRLGMLLNFRGFGVAFVMLLLFEEDIYE
jgi:hypothetical protein